MQPELAGHKWDRGLFQSRWNEIARPLEDEKSWAYGQLPEYIWLGLIIYKLGREQGIKTAIQLLKYLKELNPKIESCKFSTLLTQEEEVQKNIFNHIKLLVGNDVLESLTLVFDIHDYPIFNNCFFNGASIESRLSLIEKIMKNAMGHQTNFTTDIKYIVLFFLFYCGKIRLMQGQEHIINDLNDYVTLSHKNEKMQRIRPLIRSCFVTYQSTNASNIDFLNKFWEDLSTMSTCKLFTVDFASKEDAYNMDKDQCIVAYRNIFDYFISIKQEVFVLDEKMTVLLGLSVFAYNRFYEVHNHSLYNTLAGRSAVRGIFEVLIIMKYLIREEKNHDNIWRDYQLYGLGKYKLVCEVNKEKNNKLNNEGSHIPLPYLNILVEEFLRPEFLDIDTRYFDNTNIRKKAELVELSDLYTIYYEYLTSYEHGFWGSVRESSFVKCDNPAHQYHCIPSIDLHDNLTSVWNDCVTLMHHIIDVLKHEYGIPEKLLSEVNNFDPKSIDE